MLLVVAPAPQGVGRVREVPRAAGPAPAVHQAGPVREALPADLVRAAHQAVRPPEVRRAGQALAVRPGPAREVQADRAREVRRAVRLPEVHPAAPAPELRPAVLARAAARGHPRLQCRNNSSFLDQNRFEAALVGGLSVMRVVISQRAATDCHSHSSGVKREARLS
jgi:hypothetical protein